MFKPFAFGRKKKNLTFVQIEVKNLQLNDVVREGGHTAEVTEMNSSVAFAGHLNIKLADGHTFLAQPFETIYRQAA